MTTGITNKFAVPDLLGQPLEASLNDAVMYNVNDSKIIQRYQKSYAISDEDCTEILNAVKAHLWLSQKRQREEGKVVPILFNAFAIDEMWHTFILFTKEYHQFSYDLFNTYLHHNPCIDPEKDAILISEAESTIRYIARYVDDSTLRKWYLEWPEKYCESKMKTKFFIFNQNIESCKIGT